jgi:hypothetical protein
MMNSILNRPSWELTLSKMDDFWRDDSLIKVMKPVEELFILSVKGLEI